MIRAEELRIGNYMFDDENNICQICSLSSNKRNTYEGYSNFTGSDDDFLIEYPNEQGVYLSKVVNPIPLTEEWLLKFGFEKYLSQSHGDGYELNGWFITSKFELMVLGSSIILAKLKYVHRLQNIAFDLGEELKLEV